MDKGCLLWENTGCLRQPDQDRDVTRFFFGVILHVA